MGGFAGIEEKPKRQLWKLKQSRKKYIDQNLPFKRVFWKDYDFTELKVILSVHKTGNGTHEAYNDCIIMADTETSKRINDPTIQDHNHLCAWSIAINVYHKNLVAFWGIKPSDLVEALHLMIQNMEGERTVVYVFNLSYDWVFIRKFLFKRFGKPIKQLNVKPFYPIYIEFANGLILRDALILAQMNLQKWAENMDVPHKKAVGLWDYDEIRNQKDFWPTEDNITYICNDVLAGVECIDKLMTTLNKRIYSMPWTATGIVRDDMRKLGRANKAHDKFLRCALSYDMQQIFEQVFHGGFTHGNRHFYSMVIRSVDWKGLLVKAYDFASSYAAQLLLQKYPCEAFRKTADCQLHELLSSCDTHCFVFKLVMYKVQLVSDKIPMPCLQQSKCIHLVNPVIDNGRVIKADYLEIWLTNVDAELIANMYTWSYDLCTEVLTARVDYLPRWQTDYIYSLFYDKTMLKGCADKGLYTVKKSKVATVYGLHVQRPCKDDIIEEYEYNDELPLYHIEDDKEDTRRAKYEKYIKNRNHILNYQVGVFCTAYAMRALFELGACIDYKGETLPDGIFGEWLYSDTDSIYCIGMHVEKLKAYNQRIIDQLTDRGYGAVHHNGRDYYLGIAEHDGAKDEYTEFVYVGAKRYAGRCLEDGQLHITVAGVPKRGAECLHDDIRLFKEGFVFDGQTTKKKKHTHFIVPDIYIDQFGNEVGDSIDLSPCDYNLSAAMDPDWDPFIEEVNIQTYEEI